MRGFFVLACLCASACAGGAPRSPKPITSRDLLTPDQIERVHATTAYDAVERLRSHWLRLRGTTQMPTQTGGVVFRENQIMVYLDNQKLGTLEQLRTIEIAAVEYIRFYSPAEASARWGFNHGGGAIFVSTMPRAQ